jgi:hypothetical protein
MPTQRKHAEEIDKLEEGLAALEPLHAKDHQRVDKEVQRREHHRGGHQRGGAAPIARAQGLRCQVQQGAAGDHGQRRRSRAEQAAGPALGRAQRAHAGLAGGQDRGRAGPVHQQRQEDEDLARDEGILGARDAHREQARAHGQYQGRADLQPGPGRARGHIHQAPGQRGTTSSTTNHHKAVARRL